MTSPLVSGHFSAENGYTEGDKATPGMVRKHRQFPGASPHHRVSGRDYKVSLDDLKSGLWFFVFGEIDHHLKSLTREKMMIGATR